MGVGTRRYWAGTIAGGRWLGKAEPKNERYFSTRLLVASHADGLILYRITLHNSPNFHVSVNQTNGFTAWGVHLVTPTDKTGWMRGILMGSIRGLRRILRWRIAGSTMATTILRSSRA